MFLLGFSFSHFSIHTSDMSWNAFLLQRRKMLWFFSQVLKSKGTMLTPLMKYRTWSFSKWFCIRSSNLQRKWWNCFQDIQPWYKTSGGEESTPVHNETLHLLINFAIKILYLISNSNFSSFSLTSPDLTARFSSDYCEKRPLLRDGAAHTVFDNLTLLISLYLLDFKRMFCFFFGVLSNTL